MLHDQLKLLIDLVVLGLGAWSEVGLQLGVRVPAEVVIGAATRTTFVILFAQSLKKKFEALLFRFKNVISEDLFHI